MEESCIRKAIEAIKKEGKTFSNIYSDAVLGKAEDSFANSHAMVFTYTDHGVRRLYYCFNEEDSFLELLSSDSVHADADTVVEIMTRDDNENKVVFESAGFRQIAGMMRMSVRNWLPEAEEKNTTIYYDDSVGFAPNVEMAGAINDILWRVFDTRVSHLQNDKEIADAIRNGEFTIHCNENDVIDAVLQVQMQPRKFYINQVYNGADKSVIHAMLQKKLKEYSARGGKYVYAWVKKDNIASVKFHEKYGLKHDGMWNMVYAGVQKQ